MKTTAAILVVASCTQGRVEKGVDDALAFADHLRKFQPGALLVMLLGDGSAGAARELSTRQGLDVLAISGAGAGPYSCEAYRHILAKAMATMNAAYICVPHTSQGMEWAPALAVEMGADCLSGIDGIESVEGKICFQKDGYGGKVKGLYSPTATTTVVTVQAGAFKPRQRTLAGPGQMAVKEIDCQLLATELIGVEPSKGDSADLIEARAIVAAGNGIGSADNLALVQDLADLFPRSALAGTRLVCDQGWLNYQQQIGVTGAIVAPALYIACGISGASQHRVGMCGAEFVVAINTDPSAPIFNEADVCIVEDLIEFIPLVVAAHNANETSNDNGN